MFNHSQNIRPPLCTSENTISHPSLCWTWIKAFTKDTYAYEVLIFSKRNITGIVVTFALDQNDSKISDHDIPDP